MIDEMLKLTVIIGILTAMVRIATPLILAAIGELITERSGVMNLGVEGTMLMGAFGGFLVAYQSKSLLLAIIASILIGGIMGLILGYMTITLKIDQTVTGLLLNLLASGLTLFAFRLLFKTDKVITIVRLQSIEIPLLSKIPILGEVLFSQNLITYLAILCVPLAYFFLYRTRTGLIIRSTGENPKAVDSWGINVNKTRYLSVITGAMMAGLGGAFLTLGLSDRFVPDITAGRGWLAIIIVIAGNWQPYRMLVAALIFSFFNAFQYQLQGAGIKVPYQLIVALPYFLALIALVVVRVRTLMPQALGEPYVKE